MKLIKENLTLFLGLGTGIFATGGTVGILNFLNIEFTPLLFIIVGFIMIVLFSYLEARQENET